MRYGFVVGFIVFVVLVVALFACYSLNSDSSPIIPAGKAYSALPLRGSDSLSGKFAIQPKEYGGAIRASDSDRAFVGRAVEVDRNDCYRCAYDGKVVGYSAERESAARKSCTELGGVLTYVHSGSCSSDESIAR